MQNVFIAEQIAHEMVDDGTGVYRVPVSEFLISRMGYASQLMTIRTSASSIDFQNTIDVVSWPLSFTMRIAGVMCG